MSVTPGSIECSTGCRTGNRWRSWHKVLVTTWSLDHATAVAGTGGCKAGSTVTFDTTQTRRHSSPASSARRRNSLAALAPVTDNQYTVRSSADIKNWRGDLRENSTNFPIGCVLQSGRRTSAYFPCPALDLQLMGDH